MTIVFETRLSDSPYVEAVTRGFTASDGTTVRPAECAWHLVFTRYHGKMHPIVVGPLSSSGVISYGEGAEILWIKFRLGTFMPHLPTRNFLNHEVLLPDGASHSFWLNGSTWQYPDFENVETFVDWLARDDVLARDPVVNTALQDQLPTIPSRTLRHRFLRATGLTRTHIYQFERAQRAAALLQQGVSILDTVHKAGYFDQPHLTRSLKRFIGRTPTQFEVRACKSE